MWPLISSWRTCSAWVAASSGVSANCTPPAFMRPPVRTWDLMTTGPPMSAAIALASSAVLAKPNFVVGIPARRTISRDSYSKKRIRGAEGYAKQPVGTMPEARHPLAARPAPRPRPTALRRQRVLDDVEVDLGVEVAVHPQG